MTAKENKFAPVFSVLFGVFLGMSLLKFGNPCVLEKLVARPTSALEWLINPWPVWVSFGLFCLLVVMGSMSARMRTKAPGLAVLPLMWLGWQGVSAVRTVDGELTQATIPHFLACVVCFYFGLFSLPQHKNIRSFFVCLLLGLLVVIGVGWQQHFGGLEESRRYFFAYIYPQMTAVSSEYVKKMSSTRIFSTLFYPNALAGVLLLLLPMALVLVWQLGTQMTTAARWFLVGLVGLAGLACLVWSGSKAGWLVMLLVGAGALLRMKLERRWKVIALVMLLAAGLGGFGLRYAGYFKRGATSAAARADYWQAAVQTAVANPIFGSGPGTFAFPYKKIKKPEAEMSRLVHNDYLQQASDSGVPGFVTYAGFWLGGLWLAFRKVQARRDWFAFSVWLGLFGWTLQGLTEFGLYIPALGWTAFALMGWLLASGNGFDTDQRDSYSDRQR